MICGILLLSHTPTATTGYGRVTRRLAYALASAGHRVAVLGSGYAGGAHELPYPIFPWPDLRPEIMAEAIEELAPDVILSIGDPWMFELLPRMAQRRGRKWIAYFPLDGCPFPPEWTSWVRAVDVPVVFSRFAQEHVERGCGVRPGLIYHGVDTTSFRPQDKERAKQQANVAGHFVVGTVARNQLRKNLPALVEGFAQFAAGKPDVLLYLHTQVLGDWDMKALVRRFGVEEQTRVTADLTPEAGVPDAMLAVVYSAMDVFVLPTMAEGFGLPIMEAQACGVPVLATDFSACPELLADPVQRLKVRARLIMHRNLEQAVVDSGDIAARLDHFYNHPQELTALGHRCHKFAQQFEWAVACKEFAELIGRATNSPGAPLCARRW